MALRSQCCGYIFVFYFCTKDSNSLYIIREVRWYSGPGFKAVKKKTNKNWTGNLSENWGVGKLIRPKTKDLIMVKYPLNELKKSFNGSKGKQRTEDKKTEPLIISSALDNTVWSEQSKTFLSKLTFISQASRTDVQDQRKGKLHSLGNPTVDSRLPAEPYNLSSLRCTATLS